MYSLKKMTNENDLELFKTGYAESFSKRSKVAKRELRVNELRTSNYVYALFKKDKIVAGFILNYFPSRCLEEFSSNEQQEIVNRLGDHNVCELVGIWKKSEEKSPVTTLTLWTLIIFKTLMLDRPYIFGCTRSEKVGKEYYYQANLQVVPNPYSELAVFYYTRTQFLMTFFNSLFAFFNKNKKQKKLYNRTNEASV